MYRLIYIFSFSSSNIAATHVSSTGNEFHDYFSSASREIRDEPMGVEEVARNEMLGRNGKREREEEDPLKAKKEEQVCKAIQDIERKLKSTSLAKPRVVQIYIGKLHHSVTSKDILDLASGYGIQTALVSFKKGRNFQFITILREDIDTALLMNGAELKGLRINVNKADKQQIPSLSIRPKGSHVCFCRFSESEDGRCQIDALATPGASNLLCPFGEHNKVIGPGGKAKEGAQKKQKRDAAIAEQRQNAADPKMNKSQEQDDKCHELLKRTSVGECIGKLYYCALMQSCYHL